ncbi:hypothetical protein ACFLY9_02685, partial [Patescibacteria group bacterium]
YLIIIVVCQRYCNLHSIYYQFKMNQTMKQNKYKQFIKLYLLFVLIISSFITYTHNKNIFIDYNQSNQILSTTDYSGNKPIPNCSKHNSNITTQVYVNLRKDVPIEQEEKTIENANNKPTLHSPQENPVIENEEETSEEESPPEPSPNSCPSVTLGCVPCSPGELYCRYEAGETSGYLGWACQNNNPSNIRSDPSNFRAGLITQMGGPAPCGDKGGFLVFSTYNQGFNGVKAYIRAINSGLHYAYKTAEFTCGDCTLLQLFSKYAPNSYESYTNGIVIKMQGSVTSETKLSWIVDNRLDDFVEAIQCMEGYFTLGGRLCKFW